MNRKGIFCIAVFAVFLLAASQVPANAAGKSGELISKKQIEKTGKYTAYEITYWSTGLKVKGLMYENAKAGDKKLPGVVFNHGGVGGVPRLTKERCKHLAAEGYHVLAPSYRGEDGSEGEIEVAAGEVDDAINAVKVLRAWPGVDKKKIAMAGTSHGGIITLLAVTRINLKAAVCVYGVTNTETWYHGHLIANGFDVSDELSVKVYGEYPDKLKPEAFRSRAPALDAHKINTPVLLLYGDKDTIVPVTQGEEMAAALKKHKKEYKLKIIKGGGHGFLFHYENKKTKEQRRGAAESWSLLLDFLKEKFKD